MAQNLLYTKGNVTVTYTNNKVKLFTHENGIKTYKLEDVNKIKSMKVRRVLVIQNKNCFDEYIYKKNELVVWMGKKIDETLIEFIKKIDFYACEDFLFWGDMNSTGLKYYDEILHKIPSRFEAYCMHVAVAKQYKHVATPASKQEIFKLDCINTMEGSGPTEQDLTEYLATNKIIILQIDILRDRLKKDSTKK
jgi:hypothetical protein